MRHIVSGTVIAGVMLPFISLAGNADSPAPIFGNAIVERTTDAENKSIIGKGYYADYYGYYGYTYAYYANYYGYYGYTYGSASYYLSAYNYASSAANYLYNAYYYQTYGL